MEESQSSNHNQHQSVEVEEAGVQFDPRGGRVSAWLKSRGTNFVYVVILGGLLALAFASIANWSTMGSFAPLLLICSFLAFCFFAFLCIKNHQIQTPKVFSSKKVLSFQGFSENMLLQSGLLQALVLRISERGKLGLPEPDAKADPESGKPIPFAPGEKNKVIAEQKALETTIVEEVSGTTASGSN